jgi:hypothetical protein
MIGSQNIASQTTLLSVESDLTDVKAVTDVIPDSGAMTSISDETDKIDQAATDGLSGTGDSIAYEVGEIERHHHNWERWFGVAAVPNGEIHVADSITDNPSAFQVNGGNDTWGAWVQVLGSSDTPAMAGNTRYDLHQIDIMTVQRSNATHFIQVALGASGAAALAAGTYTEIVFRPQSVQGRAAPIPLLARRQAVGTKAWVRVLVKGQNTGTMDFYIGLHEYIA